MADLRAQQIMDKIFVLITGLSTTQQNTSLGLVYDIDLLPHIAVIQLSDLPDDEHFTNIQMLSDLKILVRAHAKKNNEIERELNKIRKEVHFILLADKTLGISAFNADIFPQGAGKIELSKSDNPIGILDIFFTIRYTHSTIDASA